MNSTEVGKKLNITAETVRKYSKMIEEESDYRFLKDTNGNKVYREEDLPIFERLIELKNNNLPLKLAAQLVTRETDKEINEIQKTDSRGNFELVEGKKIYESMIQFFEDQKSLIEKQNEKIESLEELIKKQNEILDTIKEKKEEKQEVKKSFWSRMFGN